MGNPAVVVLDTHMWVWFAIGSPNLPKTVARAIKSGGPTTVVPSACIWEALLLMEKGRLESEFSPLATIYRWLEATPMTIAPIDRQIATLSRILPFSHEDPIDRFIGATAHSLGLPLATVDGSLRSLPWLRTVY